MKNVYDFTDYCNCVARAIDVILMDISDFKNFEKGLGYSNQSKDNRPLLANVSVAEQHLFHNISFTRNRMMHQYTGNAIS